MYIAPSSSHISMNLNLPFKLILRRISVAFWFLEFTKILHFLKDWWKVIKIRQYCGFNLYYFVHIEYTAFQKEEKNLYISKCIIIPFQNIAQCCLLSGGRWFLKKCLLHFYQFAKVIKLIAHGRRQRKFHCMFAVVCRSKVTFHMAHDNSLMRKFILIITWHKFHLWCVQLEKNNRPIEKIDKQYFWYNLIQYYLHLE